MSWIESLQKAINYMEEHLLDEITIEEISKKANSSTFHFQRIFSLLTDISVSEYLRRRRLSLAAQELCQSDQKIIDLALKYGYDTPEAFSKAFRRQHGVAPSEVRKYTGKLKSYDRLVIQVILKGVEPMQYQIVKKESFQVIGMKRTYSLHNIEYQQNISQFWDEANSDGTDQFLFQANNGPVKGVLGICIDKSDENKKEIDYWIGSAHEGNDIPAGYSKLNIPASKWIILEVHGPMPHAIVNKWKRILSWFSTSGYEHAGTPELEVYSDGDPSHSDYYSEIWIPIK